MTGSNVENFGYPINLMFACSMKIFEGKFEEIVKAVAEDLKGRELLPLRQIQIEGAR